MSSQVGSYYYTARAAEQLHTAPFTQEVQTKNANSEVISDYVSTANQSSVLGQKENKAVYFSAMATFALNKSSAVQKLNAFNAHSELNNKLSQMKY